MKFEKKSTKEWLLVSNDKTLELDFKTSTVTNKYFIVTEFIEKLSEFIGQEFDDWLVKLIEDSREEAGRPKAIIDSLPKIKEYVNAYLDNVNFDYEQFVDLTKAKKDTILFHPEEIKEIIKLSSYLKIYSIFSNSENMRLGEKLHKEVYNILADEILKTEVVMKIYKVIQTKNFRYKLTDNAMWEYVKVTQAKDTGVHIIEIFNFIMNHILILCQIDKNPITYFVSVIHESVKWVLRSVYKGSMVYDDSISTEDIQGTNTDNLKTYSYNDTLGRLKSISYEKIYEILQKQILSLDKKEVNDERIVNFHERASSIEFRSPLTESIVFPVLSKMTEIPYQHMKILSPEHTAVISVYMQYLFRKAFGGANYPTIFSLLNYYPKRQPSVETTYTIKQAHYFNTIQNELQNFFGFNNKILAHKLMSYFIGRSSRIENIDILTGKSLGGLPLRDLELEMILFFSNLFANKLDKEIIKMTQYMNADF